jgi:hypothetical protein
MKKLALLFAYIFAVQFTVLANDDKPITLEQIPQTSKQFIDKHFAGKKVAVVTLESGVVEKSYDVIFSNGDKLEFDRRGMWTDIDCTHSSVPTSVVPAKITEYVNKNYNGVKILKIERESKYYDVNLSNGWELTFNKKYKVVDIDR